MYWPYNDITLFFGWKCVTDVGLKQQFYQHFTLKIERLETSRSKTADFTFLFSKKLRKYLTYNCSIFFLVNRDLKCLHLKTIIHT